MTERNVRDERNVTYNCMTTWGTRDKGRTITIIIRYVPIAAIRTNAHRLYCIRISGRYNITLKYSDRKLGGEFQLKTIIFTSRTKSQCTRTSRINFLITSTVQALERRRHV